MRNISEYTKEDANGLSGGAGRLRTDAEVGGCTILSLCARQLRADWERVCGYRPLLLETLVDAQFRGTSYRAANWIYLGETRGRGRMDQHHEAHERSVKQIYVYRLCRDAQRRLAQDFAPRWIP